MEKIYRDSERRGFVRLERVTPIDYKVCKKKTFSKLIEGYTINISQNGLLCNIKEKVNKGDILWLSFDRQTLSIYEEIEKRVLIYQNGVVGKVVRIEPKKHGLYGIGIQFITRQENNLTNIYPKFYLGMAKKELKINIGVLGDGGWGTTLAVLLSKKGFKVTLWGAFKDNVSLIKKTRENKKFLPGIKIPKEIEITHDLESAFKEKDLIVLAIPSQFIREILIKIKHLGNLHKTIFLSVSKGIEIGSLKRISEIIHEELGRVKLAVLSGPTIAHEVALCIPTVAVVASNDEGVKKYLQGIFSTDRFRIYTSEDVPGVELGGSLKNIIAIACGISDGLGFGANTKAALLSRGLVEISRLGAAMGAKLSTFNGISGLGDLVTTCISSYSRNRSLGEQIGKGKTLKQIQAHMQMIAEGVPTAKSAYLLSLKFNVDMPIIKETYNVLYKNKPPFKALNDLMAREKKSE
ncbi:MAG: NAD(P)H-dependent glycerol-3-phosphate dehydrogenase [Candidatus Omnitrophota bacterium]|nr:NAD(P)H-dependent glycerol-3-phosphate dehydrogenase [Candidatus Omnitrophota bacterium]